MYSSLMHSELATTRQRDLIAAAHAHRLNRLARSVRRAHRAERRNATTPPVGHLSLRPATQPTPC